MSGGAAGKCVAGEIAIEIYAVTDGNRSVAFLATLLGDTFARIPDACMGSFYVNFTLRGPTQQATATALGGRSAFVSSSQNGCVVAYDEESDTQDLEVVATLGAELSRKLQCGLLAVANHDDDVLWYQLYDSGRLVDTYNSTPGYFEEAEAPRPTGGDARALCEAFESSNVAEADSALRKPSATDDGYDFASDRHRDLAAALGLPNFAVGFGYRYLANGELPPGTAEDDFLEVQ